MSKTFSVLVLVLIMALGAWSTKIYAKKETVILKDHGKELKINTLDENSKSNKDDEYCDIKDPSHCDPKSKKKQDQKVDFAKSKFKTLKYNDLNKIQKKLLDAADKVSKNSHSPYSHFQVGAALLCDDGEIITGTNFENAAYGSTICAERAAILRANSQGKRNFSRIAIIGRGKDFDTIDPVSPCGSCRQVIMEISQISNKNIEVIMSNSKKDKIIISSIQELLPLGFGPQNLGIKI
jgi:cytidine deaminase